MVKSDPSNYDRIKINIKVFFGDCDHGYKELYMVTNADCLMNSIIDSRLSMSDSDMYREVAYNDTINYAFRPKIFFEEMCASVMAYIGCDLNSTHLINHIEEHPSEPVFIVSHIDVESSDESSTDILPNSPNYSRYDPYFNLANSLDTQLCLPSKLLVLNHLERVFLYSLVQELMDLPQNTCRLTYSQVLDLLRNQIRASDTECSIRDTLSGIIDTLLFYGLIDLLQEDVDDDSCRSTHYFIFSVRDINLYPEFFQILEDDQAA